MLSLSALRLLPGSQPSPPPPPPFSGSLSFTWAAGLRPDGTKEKIGNEKKWSKPKKWKHPEPIATSQLKQMRDDFWETAPYYGGRKEIWDALRAATEATDLTLAQAIIDSAGIILCPDDMSVFYDETGAKYELPKHVLSDPNNVIKDDQA